MTIDAILLNDRRHAVVVVSGVVEQGCGPSLLTSLRVARRAHTIVDLRHAEGITPEVTKALLHGLGQALDRGLTMRVVARDERQRRFLDGLGLGGLLPMHDSIAEATAAIDEAVAARFSN